MEKNFYMRDRPIFLGEARGNSMKPLINPGDKLYIRKISISALHSSDIVIYYDRKRLISHRIVMFADNSITTKGDNIPVLDSPIHNNKIVGKLVGIKNKEGYLDLETKWGYFINKYYLFFSLVTYHVPKFVFNLLTICFRGRKKLLRLILKQYK